MYVPLCASDWRINIHIPVHVYIHGTPFKKMCKRSLVLIMTLGT